jgi:archaellum biogenesis ATPase FlaH
MKAHIIVGMTDTGKSYFVKNVLLKKVTPEKVEVYDVENEYKTGESLPDFEEFLYRVSNLTNRFIVLEEATIFLDNKSTNKKLTQMLVQKKHTNNYLVLVFHSFRDIPYYIYNKCNYVTLFKTGDSEHLIDSRFHNESLTYSFNRVKRSTIKYYNETIRIN